MAAPIRAGDNAEERIAKLLPADVTAAFLSAKAGLVTYFGTPEDAGPVFWTFIAILIICPFYFWFVTEVKNYFHIAFMCVTFVIFALSIADLQFQNYFTNLQNPIKVLSIVLPFIWAFLVSRIFIKAMGNKVE